VVAIAIPISILPDHHGIATIPVLTLTNNLAVAVPITITMAVADGHADRADTNSDFFRASRHGDANCSRRDGHHYQTFHLRSSVCELIGEAIPAGLNGSGAKLDRGTKPGASRLDRKPQDQHDDGDDNRGPQQRRYLLRTAASRRVVGGVIEFVFHEGALRQRSRLFIKIEPAI
jgi:hypothetical protein